MEALEVVVSFNDFECAVQALFRPFDKLAGVGSVGPDELEASETLAQVFEDQLGAVTVLHGSFVYDDSDD